MYFRCCVTGENGSHALYLNIKLLLDPLSVILLLLSLAYMMPVENDVIWGLT